MAVEWQDAYLIGHKEIDNDHKNLFTFLGLLQRQIEKQNQELTVDEAIHFLKLFATNHFQREEECMAQCSCSAAFENEQQHNAFLKCLASFEARHLVEGNSSALLEHIYITVDRWVESHLCKVDIQLRSCIDPV